MEMIIIIIINCGHIYKVNKLYNEYKYSIMKDRIYYIIKLYKIN